MTKFMVEIESTSDDVDDVHQLLEICIGAVESDTVLEIVGVEESN